MADNDQNLVSNVVITGADTSAAQLETLANRGEAAFNRLDASAKKASDGVSASARSIQTAGQQASTGLNSLSQGGDKATQLSQKLGNLQDAVGSLTRQFPQLANAVGRFSQRMATAGAAVVAAGAGIAIAARNVSKELGGQSTALEDQTKRQVEANNAMLQGDIAIINYGSSQRKLFNDWNAGKLTYAEYRDALFQLNADYREQQRVAAEVANAQDRVREANDRLQKQLKDQTAYRQLIDTFGGPLLTSLNAFGNTVENIRRTFLSNFGPAAAQLIDQINAVVSRNSTAIAQFFDTASTRVSQLISQNGPQIQQFFSNIGAAAAAVFLGIIDAAPAIIDFFNNTLVPAIQKVVGFFQGLADAINSVFGTRLTAGSVAIILILGQITGSIRLLMALTRTFGGVWRSLGAIFGAVGEVIAVAFGSRTTAQVVKFGVAITNSGGIVRTFFNVVRSGIPLLVTLGEIIATALGVSFGSAVIIIAAVSAALYLLFTRVDWKSWGTSAQTALTDIRQGFNNLVQGASNLVSSIGQFFSSMWATIQAGGATVVQFITDSWTALLAFFQNLPTQISAFFTAGWLAVQQGAQQAAQFIQQSWNTLVAFFQALPASIGAFLSGIWTTASTTAQAAVTAIQAAWTAFTAYLATLPATLQGVWDTVSQAIINAFNTAVQTVTGYFSSLYASARQYLQPIIDLLNTIGDAMAAVGGFAGGGGVGFAEGGNVHGPGTGTSDSIPAWLSNGEYVVKARAVAKYGTAFMNRLNSGSLSFRAFAQGGLASIIPNVGMPKADLAAAGPNTGGMTPLSLSLFGETFEGLLMPQDVAGRMTRFAVTQQNKSAGRKPSWLSNRRN